MPIIHPEARIRVAWVLTSVLFICYEAYTIPYNIVFDEKADGVLLIFVSIINAYFIIDIGCTFLTGYKDDNGVLIVAQLLLRRSFCL